MKKLNALILIILFSAIGFAQEKENTYVLFTNVNVFDGKSESLSKSNVLVENNMIKKIG